MGGLWVDVGGAGVSIAGFTLVAVWVVAPSLPSPPLVLAAAAGS